MNLYENCVTSPLLSIWDSLILKDDTKHTSLVPRKVLHLRNGDKIVMSDNVKLLFETDDLTTASPATVSRAVSKVICIYGFQASP